MPGDYTNYMGGIRHAARPEVSQAANFGDNAKPVGAISISSTDVHGTGGLLDSRRPKKGRAGGLASVSPPDSPLDLGGIDEIIEASGLGKKKTGEAGGDNGDNEDGPQRSARLPMRTTTVPGQNSGLQAEPPDPNILDNHENLRGYESVPRTLEQLHANLGIDGYYNRDSARLVSTGDMALNTGHPLMSSIRAAMGASPDVEF
jgi:hypothetical protein